MAAIDPITINLLTSNAATKSTAATSPENMIVSVDSLTEDTLSQYLSAGGRHNYASLLNYMKGTDFAPKTAISSAELRQLLTTRVEEGKIKQLFNISQY